MLSRAEFEETRCLFFMGSPPPCDLTKLFSAEQPLSTEAWGLSAVAGGGLLARGPLGTQNVGFYATCL